MDDSSGQSEGYQSVTRAAGWIDRSNRVRLAISGPDRAKFLHNLTTNDVKKLPVSRGREAFVTSLQGKTLGSITMHALDDRLIVRADAGGGELIVPHFEKYGLFDEVEIDDESPKTFELHVAGPDAEKLLGSIIEQLPGADEYSVVQTHLDSASILLIRESPTGRSGFSLIGPVEVKDQVLEKLIASGRGLGLVEIDEATFDILRIEAGTPVFGRDVTEKNLPQELGRDARSISFVKGCYLGQETVARIDAIGHVNQVLRGIRLVDGSGEIQPGYLLKADGKQVGILTSTAFSPGWKAWIALGYVRNSVLEATAPLDLFAADGTPAGQGTICELPMLPPVNS